MKKPRALLFVLCFAAGAVFASPSDDLFYAVRAMDEVALRGALGREADANHRNGETAGECRRGCHYSGIGARGGKQKRPFA